jgi:hypothetical protein
MKQIGKIYITNARQKFLQHCRKFSKISVQDGNIAV